jgi:hydroxyacylglutathione hydrolase
MLHVKCFTFNAFSENTYIVYNDAKQCIIIDPGMYGKAECLQLFSFIEKNELTPLQVVNTHCHLDHVFGVNDCIIQYKIPFTFHRLEQQVYDWAAAAGQKYGVPISATPPANYFISESDTIQIGKDILEIRLAPGHSPGHVVFYNKEANFVIAGDVIFQLSIGRTDLPGGDLNTLIQSIHTQIFTLTPTTVIYSGHGPSTTVGFEQMNNEWVRS